MYTMKQACEQVGMPYETLRFYCNEGLVPNVKRTKNNYRCFDERDIQWLKSLQCLKKCGMGIKDMKRYMDLCLEGISSIPERMQLLALRKELLLQQIHEIRASIDFIDNKNAFYDGVLSGANPYRSNLLPADD